MIADNDLFWLAGFFDSGGCIYISQKNHTQAFVTICQSEVRVLERIKTLLSDLNIYHWMNPQGRLSTLVINKYDAIPLLELLVPYLHTKRKRQAEIFLLMFKGTKKYERLDVSQKWIQENLFQEYQALKRS